MLGLRRACVPGRRIAALFCLGKEGDILGDLARTQPSFNTTGQLDVAILNLSGESEVVENPQTDSVSQLTGLKRGFWPLVPMPA